MYKPDEINKSIIELVAEAIILIDDSQTIRVFNESVGKMFGYTTEEVTDRSIDVLLPQVL